MKILLLVLAVSVLPASARAGACPEGQKAVGDDSERGYKCVPRATSERPTLKETPFKTANDAAADTSYGAKPAAKPADTQGDQPADAGQAAKPSEAAGAQEKPLGGGLKMKKKKVSNRGDATPASGGCPKGWKKKGEGCAPPKKGSED